MTCQYCMKEFDSSVQVCPACGRTLVYGAAPAAAPAGPEDVTTGAPFAGTPFPNAPFPDAPFPNAPAQGMPFGGAPFPNPTAGVFDLNTTVSVSGSSSIRSRLRPRNVMELISEAFQLYRGNWKLILSLALVVYFPVGVMQFFMQRIQFASMNLGKGPLPSHFGANYFLMFLLVWITSTIAVFALTRGVSEIYLGRPVQLRDLLTINNRFWGYAGSQILVLLGMGCTMALFAVPMFLSMRGVFNDPHPGPGAVLGMLAMIPLFFLAFVVMLLIGAWFTAAGPAATIEGTGAYESLRRSVVLMRGFFWKGVGAYVLGTLIGGAIEYVLMLPATIVIFGYTFSHVMAAAPYGGVPVQPVLHFPIWISALQGLCQWIALAAGGPVILLVLVLFYYDLRIRKEGFDLQMLAEQLGYGAQAAPAA